MSASFAHSLEADETQGEARTSLKQISASAIAPSAAARTSGSVHERFAICEAVQSRSAASRTLASAMSISALMLCSLGRLGLYGAAANLKKSVIPWQAV